ncbi:TPA: hypothetical protein QCH65_003509 [Enterobacter roggenkampii]|nr:hypothetical protein [Enterobacter roggenkampii]
MPLTIRSSLCQATSSINAFKDISKSKKNATKCTLTSNGFEVQNSKTRNIKPLVSCLKPRLRMPADEYLKLKEMMDNISTNEIPKKVRFNLQESAGCSANAASSSSSSLTKSALYDDDTDLVPFEEFEPWSLQREALLKNGEYNVQVNQVTPVLISDGDNMSQPPADAGHYSTPWIPAISTDYAMPKESAKLAHYDIPRTPAISTHYSIPRPPIGLSYSNTEKRMMGSNNKNENAAQ